MTDAVMMAITQNIFQKHIPNLNLVLVCANKVLLHPNLQHLDFAFQIHRVFKA